MKINAGKIIPFLLIVWVFWIGYQILTKSESASMLLEQKIEESKSMSFNILLEKMRQGYEFQEVIAGGHTYFIGRAIVKSKSLERFLAFHLGKPRLGISHRFTSQENIRELDACIYVDYIDLFPLGYFKAGISYVLTIEW